MKAIKLNIYDKKGKEIVKTFEAEPFELEFGTILSIMELLNIEQIDDNNKLQLLKVVSDAWKELINVLSSVFPDVTADEWKRVKVKELIPVVLQIAKYSISEIDLIPNDNSKN